MKLNKSKKALVVILCICFVMASFLSKFFIINYENHQCTEKACAVCCQLENAKSTLNQLIIAAVGSACILLVLTFLFLCVCNHIFNQETVSLVTLKIRMDN